MPLRSEDMREEIVKAESIDVTDDKRYRFSVIKLLGLALKLLKDIRGNQRPSGRRFVPRTDNKEVKDEIKKEGK